jgi:hypothetical protein
MSALSSVAVDFDPWIQDLLSREDKVFRINSHTVGVADPDLMAALTGARPVFPSERSVFKPVGDSPVGDDLAMRVIKALGEDVQRALAAPVPALAGEWPRRGRAALREMMFGADGTPLSLLTAGPVPDSPLLSTVADSVVASWPSRSHRAEGSALSQLLVEAGPYAERRRAAALYRRSASLLVSGLSGMVANASWLALRTGVPEISENIIWETMRLLPTAWMLWRSPSAEFAELHPAIGVDDSVALLPLVMHRDAGRWDEPTVFAPRRWAGGDGFRTPGFAAFGHVGARCWARHLVIPLALRLFESVVSQGLRPRVRGDRAPVPLRPLLSVRIELA